MKTLHQITVLVVVFFQCTQMSAQPVKLWEIDSTYPAPESVAYDSIRDVLYVSNYTGRVKEGAMYNSHFISKVHLDGTPIDLEWIGNITTPTGICIYADKLYIVERFGVVEYDLKKDEISNRYRIYSCCFLNDITVDKDTNIYVSVSDTNLIYRIRKGQVEHWLETDQVRKPNGILYNNNKMLVVDNADHYFKSVNLETLEVNNIAYLGSGILDGIRPCSDDYLVTDFLGNLYRVSMEGNVEELINTREEKIFLADFEYIEGKDLLIIPALWNNKLIGYRYSAK